MKKNMTFEEGMEALEGIVRALEAGEMPLADTFKAYEQAVELKKRLSAMLDEGDRRIRVLTEDGETQLAGEETP